MARGQRDRRRRLDSFVGDGQVRERAPSRLGKKAPEMHPDFGQCSERSEVGVLPGRRLGVRHPGYTAVK